ncbi:hypothetical protein ES703_55341 [subsurface metagenome]
MIFFFLDQRFSQVFQVLLQITHLAQTVGRKNRDCIGQILQLIFRVLENNPLIPEFEIVAYPGLIFPEDLSLLMKPGDRFTQLLALVYQAFIFLDSVSGMAQLFLNFLQTGQAGIDNRFTASRLKQTGQIFVQFFHALRNSHQ